MIYLLTGATPGYPWLQAYRDSVHKHLNPGMEFHVYEEAGSNPCKSLQHGEFFKFIDPNPEDIIIFTDADMLMQRPFMLTEIEILQAIKHGEFWMSQNKNWGDNLGTDLFYMGVDKDQNVLKQLDMLFPYWDEILIANGGWIAARAGTYKLLWHYTKTVVPNIYEIIPHFAAIQFAICYCIGQRFTLKNAGQVFHVHGHFGIPEGWTLNESGLAVTVEDKLPAVFRHNLNLTPKKGAV